MTMNVFNARKHAENSYKKLGEELGYKGPKAKPEETDALLLAWVEKVEAKVKEANEQGEQMAQAGDNPFEEVPA
jgi:hypothetical protein